VGWVVGLFARSLVAGDGLDLRFAVEAESLVLSGLIGLLITLVTVWVASLRLARLNVISAIRDVPQPTRDRRRWLRALGGISIAAAGSLVWGVAVFSLFPDAMEGPDIDVFVLQGVVLVTSAVTLLTVNSSIWRRLLNAVGAGARGVPMRLGLTYPLAKPGRTGMLLGMYSLVIFTIVFMAVMVTVFQSQTDELAEQAGGGYELIVDSNQTNPPTEADYAAIDGVVGVAPLHRGWAEITQPGIDRGTRPVTGIDSTILRHGGPQLAEWDDEYATAQETWQAMLANDEGRQLSDVG
jgi:putative ABC transport system permease protein